MSNSHRSDNDPAASELQRDLRAALNPELHPELRSAGSPELRRRGAEDAEERPCRSLYEPSADLTALAYDVIGAAIEVHKHLGPGFTEIVYRRALCSELVRRGIPFEVEVAFHIDYKDVPVGDFRVDLIVDERLVVELKAVDRLTPVHTAQVISYLRAAGLNLGLILNFNVGALHQGIKRVVWSH